MPKKLTDMCLKFHQDEKKVSSILSKNCLKSISPPTLCQLTQKIPEDLYIQTQDHIVLDLLTILGSEDKKQLNMLRSIYHNSSIKLLWNFLRKLSKHCKSNLVIEGRTQE